MRDTNQIFRASISFLIIGVFLTIIVIGTGGCSKNDKSVSVVGTKQGCILNFQKRGYQYWQAAKYCKRRL